MKKLALAAILLCAAPARADAEKSPPEWLRQYFAHLTAYCMSKGEIPELGSPPSDERARAFAQRRTMLLERTLKRMVTPVSGAAAPVPGCGEPSSIALVRCAKTPGASAGCQAPQLRGVAALASALLEDAGAQARARMESISAK